MTRSQLSKKEKKKIIKRLFVDKCSVVDICIEFRRGRQTIYDLKRKHDETGSTRRTVKLCKKERRRILHMVRKDPTIATIKIQRRLHTDVTLATINKVLADNGYEQRGTKKHPLRVKVDVSL